jgi:hypothetical protein
VGGAVDPTRPTTPPLPRLPHAAKDRGADCPLCRGAIDPARPPPLEGGTLDRLAGRLRIRYDQDSERFFAFAMLACDRLCYNRLPCATTARLP